MKIAINRCFGGFSLSAKAVKRLAELQGKECYFFKWNINPDTYTPLSLEETSNSISWTAFSIPNPDEFLDKDKDWVKMTSEEKQKSSEKYKSIDLDSHPSDRTNPLLIQVIEELGKEADGMCAEIKIIEIPDGIEWEIDEYDGLEQIDEVHRSWR